MIILQVRRVGSGSENIQYLNPLFPETRVGYWVQQGLFPEMPAYGCVQGEVQLVFSCWSEATWTT